jgi:hypothetical protein
MKLLSPTDFSEVAEVQQGVSSGEAGSSRSDRQRRKRSVSRPHLGLSWVRLALARRPHQITRSSRQQRTNA